MLHFVVCLCPMSDRRIRVRMPHVRMPPSPALALVRDTYHLRRRHAGGWFEALGVERLVELVLEGITRAECASEGAHTGFILGSNLQYGRAGRSAYARYAC